MCLGVVGCVAASAAPNILLAALVLLVLFLFVSLVFVSF
jgi:hypothetical protein